MMSDDFTLGHVSGPSEELDTTSEATSYERGLTPEVQAVDEDPFLIEDDTPGVSLEPAAAAEEVKEETPEVSTAELRDEIEMEVRKLKEGEYRISLPTKQLGIFSQLIKKASTISPEEFEKNTTPEWREAQDDMTGYYTPAALYQSRFYDKDSKFYQGVLMGDGQLLQSAPPKFKNTAGEISGELALLKVSRELGQGEPIRVPLPHSGINVTIRPPGERAIIDFYNSIFREKIHLGRMTSGLTLSNFSVHVNNRLFDFFVSHIHSTNYADIPKAELRKYLKLPDFYILATAFAAAMYPNGFAYQRPCISIEPKCAYLAKGSLNLNKLTWVDNSALTEFQHQVLEEQRNNRLTLEHYNKYQLEHARMVNSSFKTPAGHKFHVRTPSFDEYVTDGLEWVNGINASIDATIVTEGNESETRSQILQQYVKSSSLRQFNHYIDYVEIDDSVITHRPTINKALELFSADDVARQSIFQEVLEYKARSTIAIVGIPEYKCPSCKKQQNDAPVNDRLVNVIPLDVMNLFFTLLTLRMSLILER